MYNILIASEDPQPFDELSNLLKKDFFSVYHLLIDDVTNSFDLMKQYDFILLHLNEEKEESEMLIQNVKMHCTCPLYIFTSCHEEIKIARLLESGAEGHIEMPFKAQVVAPRIKAVLRFLHQIKRGKPNVLRYGRLVLHLDNREVYIDNRQVQLTNVEFKIFQILIEHRDTVVSKDKIINYVWDQDASATDNALGIHITRLRKKIECENNQELIETVWGLGYRINLSQCEKQ